MMGAPGRAGAQRGHMRVLLVRAGQAARRGWVAVGSGGMLRGRGLIGVEVTLEVKLEWEGAESVCEEWDVVTELCWVGLFRGGPG